MKNAGRAGPPPPPPPPPPLLSHLHILAPPARRQQPVDGERAVGAGRRGRRQWERRERRDLHADKVAARRGERAGRCRGHHRERRNVKKRRRGGGEWPNFGASDNQSHTSPLCPFSPCRHGHHHAPRRPPARRSRGLQRRHRRRVGRRVRGRLPRPPLYRRRPAPLQAAQAVGRHRVELEGGVHAARGGADAG